MKPVTVAVALLAIGALTGCTAPAEPPGTPTPFSSGSPAPITPQLPSPTAPLDAPVRPTGPLTSITTGLNTPWSVVLLGSGSALISERDSGRIVELLPGGSRTRTVGTVPGAVHEGEGGLLGLAVRNPTVPKYLYAYLTTAHDNRVVRMPLSGAPGSYRLGAPRSILTGIPKGSFHDGGKLAFGPDGMLYVTTGDATEGDNAQNLKSLGGKILRVTPTGGIPADNPFPGSPVWSYGHRNPQGIAWDSHGTMWASEFGQDTWDELNIIRPGKDYGWPIVEGIAHDKRFVDPVYQWHTDQASPSGIAIVHDTIFMAALRGERLWVIDPPRGSAPLRVTSFATRLGRLRTVLAHGANQLWIVTNNTDGRGSPQEGDDRIVQVALGPP
ncbi:MAG TPA: PQQ-dependent sugar dehydrogenase [Humibacter sp.]|nr:PQQ-dependent sugar dehydrogenase [Humibacter sp.]